MKKEHKIINSLLFASILLASNIAAADGGIYEKIDGSMTATVNYGGTARAFTYKSTGFRYDNNVLDPVAKAINSVYFNLSMKLHEAVRNEAQAHSQYRSHYVSLDGPINLTFSHTPGNNHADVTMGGLNATVKMDIEDKRWGIKVKCRVTINSGELSASKGRLDLVSGTLTGFVAQAPQINHQEDCSTSLGWIPLIGNLVDKFATSKAGSYMDQMLDRGFQADSLNLKPIKFMGLDEALSGKEWPVPPLGNAAAYIRDNLWAGFQGDVVSVSMARAPAYGAFVTGERLKITFPKLGVSFRLEEYASYKLIPNPCQPACIPT